ncbi:MAG: histidine phosphatase family protein [Burkholderiaceae bacterium]|nr:histidine phosphatase family protein [Burkholderiaceae bacterium]
MSGSSRLWLVRHAPPLAPDGLCYGRSDLAADAAATARSAQTLAATLPRGVAVWSSPLQRCTALAQALHAARTDLPWQTDARLAELDFGQWEGVPWARIDRRAMDAWLADFADASPGQSGESVRRLMARVGAAFADWRASGQDALWITHAGVIRAARLLHAGLPCPNRAADWPAEAVAFGEVLVLQ